MATFAVTRAATATTRIETTGGTLVRKLAVGTGVQPGTATVTWDGKTDKGVSVHSGTYVARMTAKNELGSVGLTARFTVRRTGR